MSRITTLAIIGKLAIALVAVVVVQGILSFKFRIVGFFDLPLIYCVLYGFTLGSPIGSIVIGSCLGLMQDSLSGSVLGANGLSKTLIGFLAATAVSKFAVDQPITRILALFLFSLGDDLLVSILALIVGPASGATYSGMAGLWMVSAVFNTLLGLAVFGYHDRYSDATA
jgi:rod shape-determining protein MreD